MLWWCFKVINHMLCSFKILSLKFCRIKKILLLFYSICIIYIYILLRILYLTSSQIEYTLDIPTQLISDLMIAIIRLLVELVSATYKQNLSQWKTQLNLLILKVQMVAKFGDILPIFVAQISRQKLCQGVIPSQMWHLTIETQWSLHFTYTKTGKIQIST